MQWIKVHKYTLLVLFLLSVLYFFLRLIAILSLPIFTDEAIYVRWAQIASNDANWRFISLTDGKQPMFVWLAMIFIKFVKDPLLAGRLVSVFAGFGTLIGLFFLAKTLFKNIWIGLLTSFLYLLYPMSLVYDRMALYDGLVGFFIVWGLFLEVLLVKKIRLDLALILGLVIGGGVLTKTNAFLNIYLLPTTLLLFNFRQNKPWSRLFRWCIYVGIAVVLSYMYYSILRLSPYYHVINEKNATFYYPLKEWLQNPLINFWENTKALVYWFTTYLTIPMIAFIIGSFFVKKDFFKEKVLLVLWFLVPFVTLFFIGKVIYPRFIFFMTLSLLPLAAFTLYQVSMLFKNKIVFLFIGVVATALFFQADYFILTDFANSPIPASDLEQYSNNWPAGGGVKESVAFFKEQAKKGKIYIGTEGTFGLMPASLELYLKDDPNIQIVGYWPINDQPPKEVIEMSLKIPTYFVFYQPCPSCKQSGERPSLWPAKEVLRFKKAKPSASYVVYQIFPK